MNPASPRRRRALVAADCVLIFLLAWVLIKPLFKAKYLDRWESIESTFVSDSRFLKDHWPHPRWQPLWYLGTRFDYVYPPALRYGTALLSRVWLPVKAYHIYTGFLFCAGIAGVYFFIWRVSGSRGAGWLGAAAAALVSPSFLLLRPIREDAGGLGVLLPQRLNVLLRYGEGPHMSALALLPIALAFAYHGLQPKRPAAMALAAIFSALVVSNNFYGATALAILFPLLVWGMWVARLDHRIWGRAAAIAGLAYGLTAFWLTPSYLRVTLFNLRFVAQPGKPWSIGATFIVMIVFAALSYRLARGRNALAYPLFLCGSVLLLGLIEVGYFRVGFRVVGEPYRLAPEFDLVLILAAVESLRRLWQRGQAARWSAAALAAVGLATSIPFVSRAWTLYPPSPALDQRVEYRLQDWVAHHLPNARLMVSGSIRFWFDAWHDLAQMGGGSEQGVLNPVTLQAQWEVLMGPEPDLAVRWMQCLGVDAIIVPDQSSQEVYRDFVAPAKFRGVLPVLYDDGGGNVIYRVPRRYPGIARVVDRAQFEALPMIRSQLDLERVRAYARAVEQGPEAPVQTRWLGTDMLQIHARVAPGQTILVQASYDPAWHAYAAGRPVPVRRDQIGLMLVDAPPGDQEVRLVFELPAENLAGRILFALSSGIVLLLFGVQYWRR